MGKKIPMWQALVVMLFTIISLCYCLGVLGKLFGDAFACGYEEVHIALIVSAMFAGLVAILNGYKWSFLEAGILASIDRAMQAMLILLIVGLLIGSWIASGVVPAMIYYGLMILKPSVFLIAGCLLCCIVSLATGSSWTTAGTIGIALIGIGQALGIDPAVTGGAIVSGAYFGDKMSPLSDTTNLAPAVAGSTLFDHIRHMIYTVTPSLILALILFGIFGANASGDTSAISENTNALRDALNITYDINPFLLIPPLVVIIIVALKLPALPGLMGGVILGVIFGSIFQDIALGDWPGLLHYGYSYSIDENLLSDTMKNQADYMGFFDLKADEFQKKVTEFGLTISDSTQYSLFKLLTRGGMDSMLWTINLIICAMCFGGIMDSSGILGTIAQGLLKVAKNTGSLVTVTVFSCITMNIVTGDQYLAIVLPGRMYKEAWEDKRLKPRNLSRCLEDAGTITSPLVPWNTCGATMSKFLGVPTAEYARYAFLNLINPLVSIFYGFTGITMAKMTDAEYEAVLEQRKADKEAALKALEA